MLCETFTEYPATFVGDLALVLRGRVFGVAPAPRSAMPPSPPGRYPPALETPRGRAALFWGMPSSDSEIGHRKQAVGIGPAMGNLEPALLRQGGQPGLVVFV